MSLRDYAVIETERYFIHEEGWIGASGGLRMLLNEPDNLRQRLSSCSIVAQDSVGDFVFSEVKATITPDTEVFLVIRDNPTFYS